jgi:hypothetical protein
VTFRDEDHLDSRSQDAKEEWDDALEAVKSVEGKEKGELSADEKKSLKKIRDIVKNFPMAAGPIPPWLRRYLRD